MIELAPWFISGLALLLAAMPFPGFAKWRITGVIVALGAGQIYTAVLAFLLLLMMQNNWRFQLVHDRKPIIVSVILILGICALTAFQTVDIRTYSELAQLALYILLFVLLSSTLRNGEDVFELLSACIWACLIVAVLAFIWINMGWVVAPHIFSGRGSNEMSVFLALLGVVPCAVMLIRKRNPAYLLAAGFMCYVQYLATSRSSMAVSGLVLLVAGFLWSRNWLVRGGMVASGMYILFRNVPQLRNLYEAQLNFSARERVALLDYGWELSFERFWTGWGWGSTSRLASAAPNTVQNYPHFHNTYVQMIVELGALGWVILGLGVWMAFRWCSAAMFLHRQTALLALVACSLIGLVISGLFDAMLFGADRASQVIILFALCSRASMLARSHPQQTTIPSRSIAGNNLASLSEAGAAG